MPTKLLTGLISSALIVTIYADSANLSKTQSEQSSKELWSSYLEKHAKSDDASAIGKLPAALPKDMTKGLQISARSLKIGEHTMPFAVLNKTPADGVKPPLYICLHGGGQNAKAQGPHTWKVNSQEWQTQIKLAALRYPKTGVFIVPRMADDRLGRWRHHFNTEAFDRMISHAIADWGVDPNKVYLLGIPQGGYGTDKVLPYMADRFAAGNSMAAGSLVKIGPQTTCENLRDTPLRTDIGGNDTMFNRIGLAKELHERLDGFQKDNPGHYKHHLNVHPGKGHGGWDYGLGPEWLGQFSRNPLPETLTWVTSPVQKTLRKQFYWLGLDGETFPGNSRISAEIDKANQSVNITAQTFDKEGTLSPLKQGSIKLYLNDKMLDLDKPLTVTLNEKQVHTGKVTRSKENLQLSIESKGDPNFVFPTILSFPLQ